MALLDFLWPRGQLNSIEGKVDKLMAKADELLQTVTDLKREIGENKELVFTLATKLSDSLAKIEELIAADADDAALRAAVEVALPELRDSVDELDKLQPKS